MSIVPVSPFSVVQGLARNSWNFITRPASKLADLTIGVVATYLMDHHPASYPRDFETLCLEPIAARPLASRTIRLISDKGSQLLDVRDFPTHHELVAFFRSNAYTRLLPGTPGPLLETRDIVRSRKWSPHRALNYLTAQAIDTVFNRRYNFRRFVDNIEGLIQQVFLPGNGPLSLQTLATRTTIIQFIKTMYGRGKVTFLHLVDLARNHSRRLPLPDDFLKQLLTEAVVPHTVDGIEYLELGLASGYDESLENFLAKLSIFAAEMGNTDFFDWLFSHGLYKGVMTSPDNDEFRTEVFNRARYHRKLNVFNWFINNQPECLHGFETMPYVMRIIVRLGGTLELLEKYYQEGFLTDDALILMTEAACDLGRADVVSWLKAKSDESPSLDFNRMLLSSSGSVIFKTRIEEFLYYSALFGYVEILDLLKSQLSDEQFQQLDLNLGVLLRALVDEKEFDSIKWFHKNYQKTRSPEALAICKAAEGATSDPTTMNWIEQNLNPGQ